MSAAASASAVTEYDRLLRQLLLTFDHMPVGCMIIDPNLQIVQWNRAAEAMFGFSNEDAVGQNAMELLVPPDERHVVRERVSILRNSNDVVQGATINRTKAGERLSCVWRNLTIRDDAGRVEGFVCMAENVTTQLGVLAELEVSLARFNELTGISIHWYWEQDRDFRFTMLSGTPDDRAYRNVTLLGKTRWECRDRFIATDAAWEAHIADMKARRPFKDFIYRAPDHQGKQRIISVSGHPVYDAKGAFQGYRGVGRDISVEHETRAQLQALNNSLMERNRRHQTVMEALAEGVVMLDHEARIIDVNAAAERLLGRPAAGMIGLRNSDIEDDLINEDGTPMPVHARPSMLALATGKPQFDCVMGVRNGQDVKWRSVNAVPVIDADGKVTSVVVSMDDITGEKNTLDALKSSQEKLRHLAKFDPLTGLPNRAELHDRLRHALALADRSKNPVALLFIDLDRFKEINDTLGHAAGDQVLQEVANRLTRITRDADTVARQSGDEFIVVAENVHDRNEIEMLSRRIRAELSLPIPLRSEDVVVTPSIGVAFYSTDAQDMMDLLRKADTAMYRAKRLGGNGVQFYAQGEAAT